MTDTAPTRAARLVTDWLIEHGSILAGTAAAEAYHDLKARIEALDDPEMDATDFAHPAWWRGHDHTSKVFGAMLLEWLDGKPLPVDGTMHEPWQTIRERIAALRASQVTLLGHRQPHVRGDDDEHVGLEGL